MVNMVCAIAFGIVAAICLVIAIRHFMGHGFLLNNEYLYATKEEREKMDKTPYYRQSGVIFAMISIVFALDAIEIIYQMKWLTQLVLCVMIAAVAYAIISTRAIGRHEKESQDDFDQENKQF